jgi:hypothetical protein
VLTLIAIYQQSYASSDVRLQGYSMQLDWFPIKEFEMNHCEDISITIMKIQNKMLYYESPAKLKSVISIMLNTTTTASVFGRNKQTVKCPAHPATLRSEASPLVATLGSIMVNTTTSTTAGVVRRDKQTVKCPAHPATMRSEASPLVEFRPCTLRVY